MMRMIIIMIILLIIMIIMIICSCAGVRPGEAARNERKTRKISVSKKEMHE